MFQTIASANATSPRPSCRRLGCAALRSSSCCVASAFPSSTRCVPTASASPRYLAIAAHGVDTRSCECVLHTSESLRWSLLLCVCVVCLPATLRLRLGCAANYAGYIKATVRLLVSWFLQSLMVQKILWPEIWPGQGRTHATEKLENHENDRKSRFLSTFGP